MRPQEEKLFVLLDPRDDRPWALHRAIAWAKLQVPAPTISLAMACNSNRPNSEGLKHFVRGQEWLDREVFAPLAEAGLCYECAFVWRSRWPEVGLEAAEQSKAGMMFMPSHEQAAANPVLQRGRWSFLGYAPCPLMLVRGEGERKKHGTVAVAVNFQARRTEQIELNKRILGYGMREASRNGAELRVINAYLDSMHYPDRGRLVRETGLPSQQVHIWPGYTDKVVSEAAREFNIDLLVMGTINQRGGQGSVRRGNTTARVLAALNPAVDVLVVI